MHNHCSLKWNDHYSVLQESLSAILGKSHTQDTYCDASVFCDGRLYSVHRLFLALSSDFFATVFAATHNIDRYPVVILKDISKHVFELLLKYIYLGQVEIKHGEFTAFIEAAQSLHIKGLSNASNISNIKTASFMKQEPPTDNALSYNPSAERSDCLPAGSVNVSKNVEAAASPIETSSSVGHSTESSGNLDRGDCITASTTNERQMTDAADSPEAYDSVENFSGELPVAQLELHCSSPVSKKPSSVSGPIELAPSTMPCSVRLTPLKLDHLETVKVVMPSDEATERSDEATERSDEATERSDEATERSDKGSSSNCSSSTNPILFGTPPRQILQYKGAIGETCSHYTENQNIYTCLFSGMYSCVLCDWCTSSKEKLDGHMQTKHRLGSFYSCTRCSKLFETVHLVVTHFYSHSNEKPYLCSHCPLSFSSAISLFHHGKKHETHNYNCTKCPFTSGKYPEYIEHCQTYHVDRDSPFVCSTCSHVSNTEAEHTKHMESHLPLGEKFRCPICYYVLENKTRFLMHYFSHEKENICVLDDCDEGKNMPSEFNDLEKSQEYSQQVLTFKDMPCRARVSGVPKKVRNCPKCSFTAFSNSTLKIHVRDEHKLQICPQCPFTSKYFKSIQRHISFSHGRKKKDTKSTGCAETGKQTIRKLRSKTVSNCEAKTFPCQIFLKNSPGVVVSKRSREFKCPKCDKRFKSVELLSFHLMDDHMAAKKYGSVDEIKYCCNSCPYRTVIKQQYINHVVNHSANQKLYHCHLCSRRLIFAHSFARHLASHYVSRQFKCSICSYSAHKFPFLLNHLRKDHKKRDSGEDFNDTFASNAKLNLTVDSV